MSLLKISLNSFVRRTQNSELFKQEIKATGAQLSRKGRSRNWELIADRQTLNVITELIAQFDEESWFWVAKKITQSKCSLSYAVLLELARQDPKITVTKLMAETDCKLVQARQILDQLEWE